MSAVGYSESLTQHGLHTDRRIGLLHRYAAGLWPDRTAVVLGDRRISYRDLHRWSIVVARSLIDAGIRPGDKLLWQVPNSLEGLVYNLAGWRIGAITMPVVPLYREREVGFILDESPPTGILTSAVFGSDRSPARELDALLAEKGISPRVKYVIGDPVPGWHALPAQPAADDEVSEEGLPPAAAADEPCLVLYTSGTTSNPKGVEHCSRSLLAEAITLRDACGLSMDDGFLSGVPITHIAGLLLALVDPAVMGAKTVLMSAWDAIEADRLVNQEKLTFSQGATVFLRELVEVYERTGGARHRLRQFMCGGSVVSPAIIERADAVGITAWRAYGMTEAPDVAYSGPQGSLEDRARTEGHMSPLTQIEAVDPERRPVAQGEIGELRLRSPKQMLRYINPEVHAAQVDEDGWFYSGDVGYIDDRGRVVMTGRIKDIINRGGEKFSSHDIEQAIAAHPSIEHAAVLGVPDSRLGERVAAFITLADEYTWDGPETILRHLDDLKLAKQKFPVVWQVLEQMPMTMSGKIQKHRLPVSHDADEPTSSGQVSEKETS